MTVSANVVCDLVQDAIGELAPCSAVGTCTFGALGAVPNEQVRQETGCVAPFENNTHLGGGVFGDGQGGTGGGVGSRYEVYSNRVGKRGTLGGEASSVPTLVGMLWWVDVVSLT